jgi:predicted transcriptional regulator
MLRKNVPLQRRTRIDITAEILRIANDGAKKTQIVYGANLNFKLLRKYLDELEKAGFIMRDLEKQGIIKTTEKGENYLKYYEGFRDFEVVS